MALFRITVKDSRSINGVRIEKGMTVEVAKGNNSATTTDVFGTTDGKKMVANAFMVKYGIDVVKMLSVRYIWILRKFNSSDYATCKLLSMERRKI